MYIHNSKVCMYMCLIIPLNNTSNHIVQHIRADSYHTIGYLLTQLFHIQKHSPNLTLKML